MSNERLYMLDEDKFSNTDSYDYEVEDEDEDEYAEFYEDFDDD